MTYYGYTSDKTKLPKDNVWLSGNKLTLKDNSIVYGYEGNEAEAEGVVIMNQADFNTWLKENANQSDSFE